MSNSAHSAHSAQYVEEFARLGVIMRQDERDPEWFLLFDAETGERCDAAVERCDLPMVLMEWQQKKGMR